MKIRILTASAIALAAMVAPSAAFAQGTPVIDVKQLAQMRTEMDTFTKQLAAAKQMTSQVTTMSSTIGQIGKGSLGSLMSNAGFSFAPLDGAKGVLSNVEDLGTQSGSALSQIKKMSIPGESLSFKTADAGPISLSNGRDATKQLFFYGGSADIDATKVAQLHDRRIALLRESAIAGYATSTAMKSDLSKSGGTADKLVSQVKDSADLRGDVQANTATMLAVYAEMTKQTAVQVQMLEITSAQTLATDPTGKGN